MSSLVPKTKSALCANGHQISRLTGTLSQRSKMTKIHHFPQNPSPLCIQKGNSLSAQEGPPMAPTPSVTPQSCLLNTQVPPTMKDPSCSGLHTPPLTLLFCPLSPAPASSILCPWTPWTHSFPCSPHQVLSEGDGFPLEIVVDTHILATFSICESRADTKYNTLWSIVLYWFSTDVEYCSLIIGLQVQASLF